MLAMRSEGLAHWPNFTITFCHVLRIGGAVPFGMKPALLGVWQVSKHHTGHSWYAQPWPILSWWLRMTWCQTATRSSATTMMTLLWLWCHMSQCKSQFRAFFCLLLGVSSDYVQPITGQVTEVTCPVIGRAQPDLTPSKRQKTGPGDFYAIDPSHKSHNAPCKSSTMHCHVFLALTYINGIQNTALYHPLP